MTNTIRNLLAASLLALGCDAETPGDAAPAAPAGGSITRWTDSTELFMEHPALIVGSPGTFAVHLTDITDFAPLRSGRVTLRFSPRDGGAVVTAVQETPRAPGIYGPAPVFERPGIYDLTIDVESPQARDVIHVDGLHVYATLEEAPLDADAAGEGISFLKEQQWKTPGFRTAVADRGVVSESFQTTGEIVPAAGRFAVVSAPIGGLVEANGVAQSPAPGQRIRQGEPLAVITPTLSEGGSGSVFAAARRELREAEDEYERAKRLLAVEAIPQRRMHEAQIRLDAAREALTGIGTSATPGGQLTILAPIPGVIATRDIVPGSRVESGHLLFSIVDPSVVWLQVHVPAAQAPLVTMRARASFRIGTEGQTYTAGRIISVGSIVDARSRTVPVIFEVPNQSGALKIGSVAAVSVLTGTPVEGVVVPSTAILDEDGRPVAYVQAEGETFERRELEVGAEDRGMTLVLSGIRQGEHVVTGAAYQIRLASLSTAVPAHGHEH